MFFVLILQFFKFKTTSFNSFGDGQEYFFFTNVLNFEYKFFFKSFETISSWQKAFFAYCDGEEDELLLIDRHEEAIEEFDKLFVFVPFVEEIVILLRLNVGVTGNDEELVPFLTVATGFLSKTLLHRLEFCWIAQTSPVIGFRLIAVWSDFKFNIFVKSFD